MKKILFLLSLTVLFTVGVTAQTATIVGNTLNANNDVLTLKGERADGSTTTAVTIDANGWVGAKGATFTQEVGASAIVGTNGSLQLKAQGAVQAVSISNVGYISGARGASLGSDGISVSGNTLTNGITNVGVLNNSGTIYTGAGGASIALKANGYAEITQNLYVGGDQINTGNLQVKNGLNMTDTSITNLKAGVNDKDAVNMSQLNATNLNVTALTNTVAANKVEAKNYTDAETARAKAAEQALNTKIDLNAEAAKLYTDKETTRALEAESKINKRIDALELRLDSRINAVMSYVGSEFVAVNNRIEGLGASMVALSAAATSSVYNANKPTNLNIATGVYGKATAIAVGMSHFFNSSTKVSVNWSQGSNTKNAVGIGAGFAF